MQQCNQNIMKLIETAHELLRLADKGDIERDDDSCGVLFGIARDSAYRILTGAESEKSKHVEKGKWG